MFVDWRYFAQASNYVWSGNEGVLSLVDVVKSVNHSGVEMRGSKSTPSSTTLSINQRFINKGAPLRFQSVLLKKKTKCGSVCSIEWFMHVLKSRYSGNSGVWVMSYS